MLALVIGLCASLWFARRAEHARIQAEADATHARRLEQFTESLFTSGDDRVPAKDMTVATLLEHGVKNARALNNDPPEQAEMLQSLGRVYDALGMFDTAESLLSDSLKEREQVFGASSPEAAMSLMLLGVLRTDQGRYKEALALSERAYNIASRALPPDAPETLEAQTRVAAGWVGLGAYQKAVPVLEAIVQKERGKPNRFEDLSDALSFLILSEIALGDRVEAIRLTEESLANDRRMLGDKHPDVGSDLIDQSQLEYLNGDYAKAEADGREALAIFRGWFPPGHIEIASAETTLSDALIGLGRVQQAMPLLNDALRIQQAGFSGANNRTAHTLATFGNAEHALHHPDAALTYYERAAAQYRVLFPDGDYRLGSVLFHEGEIYSERQQFPQAEAVLRESVQMETDRLPANDKRLLDARLLLDNVLAAEHRLAEATPLLNKVVKE